MADLPMQRPEQLVDWPAAVWAGIVAGAVFLTANLVAWPSVTQTSPWVLVRLLGSIVLGPKVLAPPATFNGAALAAALIGHFVLAILFALLVAWVLHRYGLIIGILGGAVLGVALYFINFYTFTYFFPQFWGFKSGLFLLTHALFGATAGGVYEALEVERYDTPAGRSQEIR